MGEVNRYSRNINDEQMAYILEEVGIAENLREEIIYRTRDDAETRRRWAELAEELRAEKDSSN